MAAVATKKEAGVHHGTPRFADNPMAAAIGRIVILEERAAESERLRDQIVRLEHRLRVVEERLASVTRPQAFLTIEETCALLRVSARTLKRWRDEANPRIPFIVLEGGDIRYRAEAIENYLSSRERGALKQAV